MITQKITISILLIGAIFACEAKENQEMKGKNFYSKTCRNYIRKREFVFP
ncbi:hypothetical protein [Leptospira noguchii]|nr:hypothetical protein [Leptospira noguchii]UOG54994.1 hypothetical protein MAL09_22010 [Leptospira noguchii]